MALPWFLFVCLFSTLVSNFHLSGAQEDRKAYIVYMGDIPKGISVQSELHVNLLQKVVGSDFEPQYLLRSYKRSFNGFSALLTEKEAQEMAGMKGVVSVFPSGVQKLDTTKSWDFLGFPQKAKRSSFESDIIIGVLDTGIWPESDSFDDEGFGPPPTKWKGICQVTVNPNFTCNNKIIGARYYLTDGFLLNGDVASPLDTDGHGTHTAATAAGVPVGGAGLMGLGLGTARGGVPSARIAAYKVCWGFGCDDGDILAGFDDAISDGVDVITASFGSSPTNYFTNANAIGSFHAMKKGILTTFSAGNRGPRLMSVGNIPPWALSVAATTMNRQFLTDVRLGNSKTYEGQSINTFDLKGRKYPIIYGGDAANTSAGYSSSISRHCIDESLDKDLVKGKILLCDDYGLEILGGVIGVVTARQSGASANIAPMPSSSLTFEEYTRIFNYMNSTRNATASISKSKEVADKLAPYVAAFSARGPNPITSYILKPDLAAPGVYILAAWSPHSPISSNEFDPRSAPFNIISGTSMACPHVAAVAAYVKSFHPTWSPIAIKSALMTTAIPIPRGFNQEAEFAYGTGQINPIKAPFPGLVYDAGEDDYINFLCAQGYNTKLLQIVTGNSNSFCAKNGVEKADSDVNYPALVFLAPPSEHFSHVFNRTVTNVGSSNSTYKAKLMVPPPLRVSVSPSVLSFSSIGEKRSYAVTVQGMIAKSFIESASLVWDDGTYQVRSPIVVYVPM